MLLTQRGTIACTCGKEYKIIEGLKHNSRLGTERVVWKKVRVGTGTLQFQPDQWYEFACIQCGANIRKP